MNKIALIPSYEPDYRLVDLVHELYDNNFEIIVVNDGSNYKYDNLFRSINNISKVIENKENKGKGYALKKGLEFIKDYNDSKDYESLFDEGGWNMLILMII